MIIFKFYLYNTFFQTTHPPNSEEAYDTLRDDVNTAGNTLLQTLGLP